MSLHRGIRSDYRFQKPVRSQLNGLAFSYPEFCCDTFEWNEVYRKQDNNGLFKSVTYEAQIPYTYMNANHLKTMTIIIIYSALLLGFGALELSGSLDN